MHLAGEEHHRVGLAGPLRVPEYAELAAALVPPLNGFDGPVDAQELLVLRDDLDRCRRRSIVEQDEVLEQVQEVRAWSTRP